MIKVLHVGKWTAYTGILPTGAQTVSTPHTHSSNLKGGLANNLQMSAMSVQTVVQIRRDQGTCTAVSVSINRFFNYESLANIIQTLIVLRLAAPLSQMPRISPAVFYLGSVPTVSASPQEYPNV